MSKLQFSGASRRRCFLFVCASELRKRPGPFGLSPKREPARSVRQWTNSGPGKCFSGFCCSAAIYRQMDHGDPDLLRAYAVENSERAFAQLVERYVRLVFGTAMRLVSDEQTAQEITQEVFIELARKAAWLSGEV